MGAGDKGQSKLVWLLVAVMAVSGAALTVHGFFFQKQPESKLEEARRVLGDDFPVPPPRQVGLRAGTVRNFCDMQMVWIPPGRYTRGSPETEADRRSGEHQHEVVLTQGFWLGKYEVTNAQFRRFVEATGYETEAEAADGGYCLVDGEYSGRPDVSWRNPGWEIKDNDPVVMISWNDATAYIEWLDSQCEERFRLPTGAEWEYACRAGTTTTFIWGDSYNDGAGWCNGPDLSLKNAFPEVERETFTWDDGYVYVAPVGSFRPNAWGLHDMPGNVTEWCQDYFQFGYKFEEGKPLIDPKGPDKGEHRLRRGGAWILRPRSCRSAMRINGWPYARGIDFGMRVAMDAFGTEMLGP